MTAHDVDLLKVYVLLSPVLVFGLALGVVWLTGWMDQHDQRSAE
jgi:hypothetical protein